LLKGQVSEDIITPDSIITRWVQISGPGYSAFINPADPETPVCFDTPGTYVLRLAASDGEITTFDDIMVSVSEGIGSLPACFIESPANGTVLCEGNNIPVTAMGFSQTNITVLRCYANGSLIGSTTGGVLNFTWNSPSPGIYNLMATAADIDGNAITSSVVTITIDTDHDGDGLPDSLDPDDDNDGLPDTWETLKELNPMNATGDDGPHGDPDHDALTNAEEFEADTHPRDATSTLRILGVQKTTDGLQVTWQGGQTAFQELEGTTNLISPAQWIPLYTNMPPTSVTNQIVFPAPPNPMMFFRLRAWRP